MLIAFRAENVRSFRDTMELSLLATAVAEDDVARDVTWRAGGQPLRVLPAAGIFGANASGKSNVLKAMDDMRGHVLRSFRHGRPTGGLPHDPFLLQPSTSESPSSFEVDIVLAGVRHEYGFRVDGDRVVEEWASRYPRGRAALLFRRTGDDVVLGAAERGKGRAVRELLRPNALFLSTAASANHPLLLPLYAWFERNLVLAEAHSRPFRLARTTQLLDDPARREQVLALLRAADLGITGASRHELDAVTKDRLQRAARILMGRTRTTSRSRSTTSGFASRMQASTTTSSLRSATSRWAPSSGSGWSALWSTRSPPGPSCSQTSSMPASTLRLWASSCASFKTRRRTSTVHS